MNDKIYVLKILDKFNFDYAHFLGEYMGKCFNIHGHTSSVNVSVLGYKDDIFLIDFCELKNIVKDVIDKYDHKLLVAYKYVVDIKDEIVHIKYGRNVLYVEYESVMILPDEPTVETISMLIANEIAHRIEDAGYENIECVVVEMSEGAHNYCEVKKYL